MKFKIIKFTGIIKVELYELEAHLEKDWRYCRKDCYALIPYICYNCVKQHNKFQHYRLKQRMYKIYDN